MFYSVVHKRFRALTKPQLFVKSAGVNLRLYPDFIGGELFLGELYSLADYPCAKSLAAPGCEYSTKIYLGERKTTVKKTQIRRYEVFVNQKNMF